MPQHTVTAFRWTGTGYNAQYNTSYTAVLDDDDGVYLGGGDSNETISINGGAFNSSLSTPYVINVSFTDTNGDPHVEPFYFFNTAGPPNGWYFIPEPSSAFTVGATLGSYQSHTTTGWNYTTVTCFADGSLIETPSGAVAVEALKAGDAVLLADGGKARLKAVLSSAVPSCLLAGEEKLKPVKISAGALGDGLPRRDLWVSRQHRMLVSSPVCERMFGAREVFVAAHRLCALPGIYIDEARDEITYYHLVFDAHEVVLAEGAPSESFFPGPEALKALAPEAKAEFEALFGSDHSQFELARIQPPARLQRKLVARHCKNAKPLVACGMR